MRFSRRRTFAIPRSFHLTTYEGIKRTGPPQAIQKLREEFYMAQVTLSDTPSADWKRLFYETQQSPSPDFPPRAVDISGNVIRFRTDSASIQAKTAWVDRWIDRANQKEAAMGGKLNDERLRRREEHQKEQQELAAVNAQWEKF
jgi:hypothetical protein